MHDKNTIHLWRNLTDTQQKEVTNLIERYAYEFNKENAIEKCGGGTTMDYYRIQLEFFVLGLLQSLKTNQ